LDAESQAWLADLRAGGTRRDAAAARLHDLLLRAARHEISRRRGSLPETARREVDDLAVQAADDALAAVLAKLDGFRGASRFTTWAYKFAILEAGVRCRVRAWQDREVTLDPDRWPTFAQPGGGLDDDADDRGLIAAIADAARRLTPHQREVLVALAIDGVPIDVLADRLHTSRGALYKTLHDARRKLRAELEGLGWTI
jgi:RNA polymerase sigma-70 factor (ECF subfamily)